MKKSLLREVQSAARLGYSAGAASILQIGNLGAWLYGLDLDFVIAKTDAVSPAPNQDWLARVVTGLTLIGGGRTYISCRARDLRPMYWANRIRLAGAQRMPDNVAGTQTFRWKMSLLFAPDPLKFDDQPNLWDGLAGVAPDNNLTLEIDWAATTAIGTNITIATTTLCEVSYYLGYPGGAPPKWLPNWTSGIYTPSQTYGTLQGSIDVPVNAYYRRTTQVIVNGAPPNDVRTDGTAADAISEIGIGGIAAADRYQDYTRSLSRRSQFKFAVADDNANVPGATAAYGASTTKASHNPGVVGTDWAQFVDQDDALAANDPIFGLNQVASAGGQPKAQGSARLLYTVDAQGANGPNVLLFHEAYQKYPWG